MSSLKGFIPTLGKIIGMTPDALYERQRMLVRAGLLDAGEGRGPGSGVRATPETVALLLIAVLASEGLADVERRVGAIAQARVMTPEPCELTGKRRFGEALAELFDRPSLAGLRVLVSRTSLRAEIEGLSFDGKAVASVFAGKSAGEPAIGVSAVLLAGALGKITKALEEVRGDQS
ncbi:MAG TPA: hypothetical protein VLX09_07925 [Stellaceae bacterium]|nr:hypothetical protein [Stellaceae bacterium]